MLDVLVIVCEQCDVEMVWLVVEVYLCLVQYVKCFNWKFVLVSMCEYVYVNYLWVWVDCVEWVGNLNYFDEVC